MDQQQRRRWLIGALLQERTDQPRLQAMPIPEGEAEQKQLLRALFNIRPPMPASQEFLAVQDAYLQQETRRKGVTDLSDLAPVQPGLYLWQGDITTLRCDAIVNAANSQMLGCFCPTTAASTMPSTPLPGCSCGWSAPARWSARAMRNPPAGPKSPRPTTCPAGMCCIRWGPSCMAA